MKRSDWICVFGVAAVVLAVGSISSHDVDTIEAAENQYQVMVCEGAWGDYNQINPDCGEENEH